MKGTEGASWGGLPGTHTFEPYFDPIQANFSISDSDFCAGTMLPFGLVKTNPLSVHMSCAANFPRLHEIRVSIWAKSCLSRPMMQWCIPSAVAPPIGISCSNRAFLDMNALRQEALSDKLALYGVPPTLVNEPLISRLYESQFHSDSISGLLRSSPFSEIFLPTMQVPEGKRLIFDSAKLAKLDLLLQELKSGDHKVLIYFQMTKMMDLMEEYLIYRQYKYLRLDGSSKLEDRRDMVMDWQTR